MSVPEQQLEWRSSVKIALNAKHEAQIEVKAYTAEDEELVDEARAIAVETFKRTYREIHGRDWSPPAP